MVFFFFFFAVNGEICKKKDLFGKTKFSCPRPQDPASYKYCCGDDDDYNGQYCCPFDVDLDP